jgi:cyclase
MTPVRVVARLDIKGANLIKGIQLEGLRVVGNPNEFARSYYEQGADELLYIDAVASLYGRNNLFDIVRRTTEDVFIPVTVGGGVRNIDDVRQLLQAGADKVAINTAAIARPELITEAARTFGSQCIVISIAAKRRVGGGWEAYVEGGREHTGVDAVEWAARAVQLGAGEVIITSVDQEGGCQGYDIELTESISNRCDVPVIASGGAGTTAHLVAAVRDGGANAIAVATILHFKKVTVADIKHGLSEAGIPTRPV